MAAAAHKPRSWGTGKTLLLAAGGGLTAGSVLFGMQGEDAPHAFGSALGEHRPNRLQLRASTCQGNKLLSCSLVLGGRFRHGLCKTDMWALGVCCLAHCMMRNPDMGAAGSVGMLHQAESHMRPSTAAHEVRAGEGLCILLKRQSALLPWTAFLKHCVEDAHRCSHCRSCACDQASNASTHMLYVPSQVGSGTWAPVPR